MLLDDAVPRWDRRSTHRIAADLPPAVLLRAVEEVTWGEVPLFRVLLTLRGLGGRALKPDAPVLAWFTANGFVPLGRTDDEMLVAVSQPVRRGAAGRSPSSVESFRANDEPACIKIATSFRAADGYLVTETRVHATDARSRRVFAVYWLLIRAGSGVIRRVWLRAIRSRAHASTASQPVPRSAARDPSA